jgi:hypothetical protein
MDDQAVAIRAEVAFWGLLVMASTAKGFWLWFFLVLAVLLRLALRKLDTAMSGEPLREGFWSRVWRR